MQRTSDSPSSRRFVSRLAAPCLALVLSGCLSRGGRLIYLEQAETLSRQGEFDSAIENYRKHIEFRLRQGKLPDWENPHLYLLIIGDIELRRERVDEALAAYEQAEQKGIDTALVADRFRLVARWYEERGELEKAFDVLGKYRERDPLLMDLMRDRIAREIVAKEESPSDVQRGGRAVFPPHAP